MHKFKPILVAGFLTLLANTTQAGVDPITGFAIMDPPFSNPDIYSYPNWTFSPLPTIDPVSGAITGGLHKFKDSLPGFCALGGANVNALGQCLPIATPNTTMYPGSDYYKIELKEYSQKLHSDLPATPLRGYHETGSATAFNYLGPVIIAQRDRPVRLKFTNNLTTDREQAIRDLGYNLIVIWEADYSSQSNKKTI